MRNLKLQHALRHAERGIPVFPVQANGKLPAFVGWQQQATTDPAKITRWWDGNPDLNIGGLHDSHVGADLDIKKDGIEHWKRWKTEKAARGLLLPPTYVERSANGGIHHIYSCPYGFQVRNSVGLIAPGVDVRGRGGYLVLAGSTIKDDAGFVNSYTVIEDRIPAEAPEWLIEACRPAHKRDKAAAQRLAPETEQAVEQAEWWLQTHAPRDIADGERNGTLFKVAAKLYDIGLDEATVEDMLLEWNYDHVSPPLDEEDVRIIAGSAAVSRNRPRGVDSPDIQGFDNLLESAMRPKGLPLIQSWDGAQRALDNLQEPLIKGLLDCGTMSVLYGESNTGKSFVAMDQDFHIAAGMEWGGRRVKQGTVIWVAAEGGAGVYKRLRAWHLFHGRKGELLPLYVIPAAVDLLHGDADVTALIEAIRRAETLAGAPVLKITIDTLARVIAGGNENDAGDMGGLVRNLDKVRAATGAHVMVIHHSGKDTAKGARGSSALRAATDTEIEIKDRSIKVRKQRDLDTAVFFKFELPIVEMGDDKYGDPVTSCAVVLRTKVEVEAEEEKRAQFGMQVYEALNARPFGEYGAPFSHGEAAGWLAEALGIAPRAAEGKLYRAMPELIEDGVLVPVVSDYKNGFVKLLTLGKRPPHAHNPHK